MHEIVIQMNDSESNVNKTMEAVHWKRVYRYSPAVSSLQRVSLDDEHWGVSAAPKVKRHCKQTETTINKTGINAVKALHFFFL